jgi:hypothetical protein
MYSLLDNLQILEVVRLEGQALTHDEALLSRDIHLLQVNKCHRFAFVCRLDSELDDVIDHI